MGLLDDAIRQHLELKKRKGDDLEEVWETQRDVLGETEESEGSEEPLTAAVDSAEENGAASTESTAPPTPIEALTPDPTPEPASQPSAYSQETVEWQIPAEIAAAAETTEAAGQIKQPDSAVPERIEETAPANQLNEAAVPAETRTADQLNEPTSESEQISEDLLEGVPDFLEQTPEYDRLWFEQKPPRNFDFGD